MPKNSFLECIATPTLTRRRQDNADTFGPYKKTEYAYLIDPRVNAFTSTQEACTSLRSTPLCYSLS